MSMIAYLIYRDGMPDQAEAVRLLAEGMPAAMQRVHPMSMPMPIPGPPPRDLAQEAAWPGWQDHWPQHRGHLMLTTFGKGRSFEALCDSAEALLQGASVLVSRSPVLAVGWSANLLYHPAAAFSASLARGMPPVDVLVRCQWRGRGPTTAARTEGLAAFGLPEFDHEATGEDPDAIYNRIMNLCFYVLQDGKLLGDGDTIGTTPTAELRVRHGQDDSGALVLVLRQV